MEFSDSLNSKTRPPLGMAANFYLLYIEVTELCESSISAFALLLFSYIILLR